MWDELERNEVAAHSQNQYTVSKSRWGSVRTLIQIQIGASAADDVADENKNLGTHNQLPETNTLNHCDAMNT